MQCICVRDCYIRVAKGEKPKLFRINDMREFEKCPQHFVVLDSAELDFETVPLEVLLESDGWEKADLIKLADEKYKLKISKNTRRDNVARKFVTARDRHIEGVYDNAGQDWME